MIYTLFLFFLFFIDIGISAQQEQIVEAKYIYYAQNNETLEEAKLKAFERAKIQAIADVYGTVVSQTNSTKLHNKNGQSSVDFLSIGGSEVKGEWIETYKGPDYNIRYEDNILVIEVYIKGLVREMVYAPVMFEAKLLRNGLDKKYESHNFEDGDDLYMFFCSPLSGYLAIYMVDDTGIVYCLLPYQKSDGNAYPVFANKNYILFSTESVSRCQEPFVDEYVMTCKGKREINIFYIIFSPNSFAKVLGKMNEDILQIKYEDFQKWLAFNRKHDKKMQVMKKIVTIEN